MCYNQGRNGTEYFFVLKQGSVELNLHTHTATNTFYFLKTKSMKVINRLVGECTYR